MDYLNIIVKSKYVLDSDKETIFGSEDVVFTDSDTDIFDLLVLIGSFKSKTQAKKNWNGPKEIPYGFSEFCIGKIKRHLTIWNTVECENNENSN
jgi:hypothetical protein